MSATAPVEQRYARWLEWGTRLGLALLVLGFLAYASGIVAPHVPIERLPELWSLPSGEFMQRTGQRAGWSWLALTARSDVFMLAAIALLASCSLACLAVVVPLFKSRGERAFVAICLLQIVVLAAAAFAPHP